MIRSFLQNSCLILLGTFVIVACQSTGEQNIPQLSRSTLEKIQQLLYLANSEPSPFSERHSLEAASLLVDSGQMAWADELLQDLDTEQLNDQEFKDFTIQYAAVQLQAGSGRSALKLLQDPRFASLFPQVDNAEKIRVQHMRARAHNLEKQPFAMIEVLLRTDALLGTNERQKNQKILWDTLMNMSAQTLQKKSRELPSDIAASGQLWFDLARLIKQSELGAEQKQSAIAAWQARAGDHPAVRNPPPEMRPLLRPPLRRPEKIALLLPLSGPLGDAGEAVREGYLAALYAAQTDGEEIPTIEMLDTGRAPIQELYLQAVEKEVDWVIGPLRRENLEELADLRLTVPVLALNWQEKPGGKENLYQFSLHAEDELAQLTQAARRRGWHNVLLLRPEEDWSLKTADRFVEMWTESGGVLGGEGVYSNERNISNVVRNTLRINRSMLRARLLEKRLQTQIQSEPRPRKDIDTVVLLASPESARLLKPVLKFHRAGSLPVLSISRIYDGQGEVGKNADLNDIVFSETPWLLEASALRETLQASGQNNFTRMHAIGATVWQLLPWLQALGNDRKAALYSSSGRLSIESDGRIRRHLSWAIMREGQLHHAPDIFPVSDQ